MSAVLIRPSTAVDLDAVTRIYAWNVEHGTGTFELEAPDLERVVRPRCVGHGDAATRRPQTAAVFACSTRRRTVGDI